jgi:hypothetical protein
LRRYLLGGVVMELRFPKFLVGFGGKLDVSFVFVLICL